MDEKAKIQKIFFLDSISVGVIEVIANKLNTTQSAALEQILKEFSISIMSDNHPHKQQELDLEEIRRQLSRIECTVDGIEEAVEDISTVVNN